MTKLPVTISEKEAAAIDIVAGWIAPIRERLRAESGKEWLEKALRQNLREGNSLTFVIKVVEAADKQDDELADAALREVGAELQTALIQKRNLPTGHLQIIGYLQRVASRPPHRRKRGGAWYINYVRDVVICSLIGLACRAFGVDPTRNRESRRADRYPSGCSLVTKGWERHGVHLEEGSVQEHIWGGYIGDLVRRYGRPDFLPRPPFTADKASNRTTSNASIRCV